MKKHADGDLGHSVYTDNANLGKKVALRKFVWEEIEIKNALLRCVKTKKQQKNI